MKFGKNCGFKRAQTEQCKIVRLIEMKKDFQIMPFLGNIPRSYEEVTLATGRSPCEGDLIS